MGDRSNVSHRVLNAVRTVSGSAGSLENFIGLALVDGAQCFVTDEEANYRWLAKSTLVADGRFVVKASGPNEQGRWVRESASVGFAMLEEGHSLPCEEGILLGGYAHKRLVQFEMHDTSTVVYRGTTSRLAMIFGRAFLNFDHGSRTIGVLVERDGADAQFSHYVGSHRLEMAGWVSVSCSCLLAPGDRLSLRATNSYAPLEPLQPDSRDFGSLCVVLA